jgi:hypothetical protein
MYSHQFGSSTYNSLTLSDKRLHDPLQWRHRSTTKEEVQFSCATDLHWLLWGKGRTKVTRSAIKDWVMFLILGFAFVFTSSSQPKYITGHAYVPQDVWNIFLFSLIMSNNMQASSIRLLHWYIPLLHIFISFYRSNDIVLLFSFDTTKQNVLYSIHLLLVVLRLLSRCSFSCKWEWITRLIHFFSLFLRLVWMNIYTRMLHLTCVAARQVTLLYTSSYWAFICARLFLLLYRSTISFSNFSAAIYLLNLLWVKCLQLFLHKNMAPHSIITLPNK